jgi:hypothetical protein
VEQLRATGKDAGGVRLVQLNSHDRSEQNPHTLTPEGDRCFACGREPPGDEGERWQRFEDIPHAEGRPLTEDVLRRVLKDATLEELHRQLESAEKNGPAGEESVPWLRKLISEREED